MTFIRKIKRGGRVYLAEVENRRINGKVVQKHLRYVGREADGETVLSSSLSNVEVEEVKLYGPVMVLNFLAEEIGLSTLLGDYSQELLSMVYAHCLDYKSINQMQQWFQRTDLNMILDLEGLTERRLLAALDSLEKRDSELLQREIFESVKQTYRLTVSGVLYDVTNTYLYGTKCAFAKPGHDKEGVKGRPLVQVGLGVTEQEGIPLFHKVFDGNVHDAKTLHDLISCFRGYAIKSGLLIYDRGIISSKNLEGTEKLGWNTLCGLPIRGKLKKVLEGLIAKNDFIQLANRVSLNKKEVFYVVTTRHHIDKVKGTLAICFNERQRRLLRESRYDEIQNAQRLVQEGKAIKENLKKYFNGQGTLLKRKLTEAEKFDGYSCIFVTKRLSKEKIVRRYFDKDLVEKAFRTLKGIVRLRPIRHWLYNRVVAHIFICYLSYLLLAILQYKLRRIKISPEEALRELGSMYKIYMKDSKNDFRINRTVTLNKKQEKILRAISPKLLKDCSV